MKVKTKNSAVRFEAVGGSRLTDADATVVGRELSRLEEAYGELKPEHVVAAARSRTSPLHRYFTWNRDKAHERLLCVEARYLIRSVRVVVVLKEGGPAQRMPLLVRLTEDHGYRGTLRVLSEESSRSRLLAQALRELNAWYARYQHLKELVEVFSAVRKTLATPGGAPTKRRVGRESRRGRTGTGPARAGRTGEQRMAPHLAGQAYP